MTKEVRDRTQAPGLEQTYRGAGRCWPPEVTSPSPLIRSLPTIPIPPTPRVRRTPLVADVVVFSALSSAFFCYSCPFLFPLYHPPFFAAHAPFFLDTHAIGSKQSAEQATHTHKKCRLVLAPRIHAGFRPLRRTSRSSGMPCPTTENLAADAPTPLQSNINIKRLNTEPQGILECVHSTIR